MGLNEDTTKPFKLIEIPLSKFKEEAIPFHRGVYEKRRNNIQKLINGDEKSLLRKEAREIDNIINQLKDLALELVTLKAQVRESDITKYKSKADPIYNDISDLICKYNGLQQLCMSKSTDFRVDNEIVREDSFVDLQIQANLEDLKLEEHYNRLKNVEDLQEDIQNVHEMFVDLHQMVGEQKVAVDIIEENVEHAQEDVKVGFKEILKASKMKKASYPLLGASFGAIAGGPVGAAVGIKAGLIVAATCAVFGYFSGRYFRTHNDAFIARSTAAIETAGPEAEVAACETPETDKKND